MLLPVSYLPLYISANSRSGSPSSRLSYLTHTTGRAESTMTPGRPRRQGMVRSQGASREGSPTRMNLQPGKPCD